MKKFLAVLVSAVLAVSMFALVGCGEGSSQAPSTPNASQEPAPVAQSALEKAETYNLIAGGDYVIGDDIPAGDYTFVLTGSENFQAYLYESEKKGEREKDFYLRHYSPSYVSPEGTYSVSYRLQDGKFLSITKGTAILVNMSSEDAESAVNEAVEKAKNANPNQESVQNATPQESSATQSAATPSSSSGYQAIYDEYSKKVEDAAPTSSITELATISNEGVTKMAEYMYSASGTDGQYATYNTWSQKLMNVYLESAK